MTFLGIKKVNPLIFPEPRFLILTRNIPLKRSMMIGLSKLQVHDICEWESIQTSPNKN